MAISGFGTSPEVTAITSMPLNDNMPRITAIHTPLKAMGHEAAGQLVEIVTADRLAGRGRRSLAAPRMMNSTIAVTLMSANQYSTVPKLPTERTLT